MNTHKTEIKVLVLFIAAVFLFGLGCPQTEPAGKTPPPAAPPAKEAPVKAEEAPEAPETDEEGEEGEENGEADEESADADDPTKAPADVAAPPSDAEVTDSGLSSKVLRPGTGEDHPEATSLVTVHYTGWTTDGKMFDSSVARGSPTSFPLNRVIPGWTEGLQLMVAGEKRRLWIPENLAYAGRPGFPAGMLVFDVELISFQ